MSEIQIIPVSTPAQIKTFVRFPFQIYKNNNNWVPYLISDEFKFLQKKTNPAFEFCEASFWLAYRDNKCVGRIGAIINKLYNDKVNEAVGRFSRAEFIDDKEVSYKLFTTVEAWLKEKGMTKILGPLGFNNLDNQGMLVEGFDYLAAIGSVYHMPYYHKHLESLGYDKEIDWVEFRLKIGEIPEKATRLNKIIQERYQLKTISFKKKKDIENHVPRIFALLSESFSELPFVNPFSANLIEFYSKKYVKLLVPKYLKIIVDKDNTIMAFIVSIPTISRAMQKAKGKLFPFGFIHLLKALKNPTEFEILLTGIIPKLQRQGLPSLLITELQKEMLKTKAKWVETTGIFETNLKAIEHWKNYEHIQHKRKRCYRKML